MSTTVAAVLAGLAAAVLVGTPPAAVVRLSGLREGLARPPLAPPLRPVAGARTPGSVVDVAARRGPAGGGAARRWLAAGPVAAAAGGVALGAGPEPVPRWAARAVPAVAGAAVAVAAGPVPGVLAAGVVGVVLRVVSRRAAAAGRAQERARAVEACGALAAELRAGRAPADALQAAADLAVGPTGGALRAAAATARLGGDVAEVLRAARSDAAPTLLPGLATCWAVCAGTGSGLAAAVDRLEQGLRDAAAQRRAVDAELAGPRATAGMLAVLPVVGLLLAAALGADPLHVLLRTPVGLAALTLGVALEAAGVLWTARLVERAGGGG